MKPKPLAVLVSFVLLFLLYHAAEYMILFRNSPAGFLFFQLLFFIAAWYIGKRQGRKGLATWGLGKKFISHLLLGLGLGILLYGGTLVLSLALGWEKLVSIPTLSSIAAPLGLFVFGNLFSSFSEDILTRGFVWHHLQGRTPQFMIILVSATVYLLNHIYRLDDGAVTWLYLFTLGVLYVLPLVQTRSLWITGGMHWAGNVTFFLTHQMWKTEETNTAYSPNLLLVAVALSMIPLTYLLLKRDQSTEKAALPQRREKASTETTSV